jgi:hypothetical protein
MNSAIRVLEQLYYHTFVLFEILIYLFAQCVPGKKDIFSISIKVENKVLKVVTINLIKCNLVLNNLLS